MIDSIALNDWLDFDARFPAPTFFATPAWALALADTHRNMFSAPLRVCVHGEAPVIVPLMRMHGGALRWRDYHGFPLGGYTCFMREDGTLADAVRANHVVAELARHADTCTLTPWPLGPAPTIRHDGAPHETAIIDLRSGIDAAVAGLSGISRRMAGQAARRGVTCAPDRSAEAIDAYYELLEASAKRWGLERPAISKAFIAALCRRGADSVEIWFARAEGRRIAGGIVFYGSQELFFWSAAMLAEYGRLRPSNALNIALMRAAAARGMSWYNLGSSEGLPGVARFKHDLGAGDVRYRDVALTRTPYRLYRSARSWLLKFPSSVQLRAANAAPPACPSESPVAGVQS
jgi:CelD/BcsL family acetyltransferase involved in cellulose biosynthesis